jgi:hypothetical protein
LATLPTACLSFDTRSFGFLQDHYQQSKKLILVNQKQKIEISLSFSPFQRRIDTRIKERGDDPRLHPGDTPMKRILGLTVAFLVPMSLATTAHAQSYYNGGGTVGSDYGTVMADQPYGGFGHQYTPAIPAGGVIVDQWGGLHTVGYTASTPSPAAVTQPQPRSTATRSRSRRALARPRYVLPSGSLGSSGGNGGMLYSPDARYSSYGSGYNVGPYGVVNHNMMWKW